MKHYDKQYINGVWQEGTGDKMMENYNPYTGKLIYSYRSASIQDVDAAYDAAKKAQKSWAEVLPEEKRTYMKKLAQVARDMEPEIYNL